MRSRATCWLMGLLSPIKVGPNVLFIVPPKPKSWSDLDKKNIYIYSRIGDFFFFKVILEIRNQLGVV